MNRMTRKAVIGELREVKHMFQRCYDKYPACLEEAIDYIDQTPQPERKKGKWIYNSPVTMKCDQCGFVIKDWDWHRFKFCPNCGCAMEGKEE